MSIDINDLICRINEKIKNYESKMNLYKIKERELLEKIPSFYDYIDGKIECNNIDLIYSAIILNDNFNEIDTLYNLSEELKSFINDMEIHIISDCFNLVYSGLDEKRKTSIKAKMIEDGVVFSKKDELLLQDFDTLLDLLKYINEEDSKSICSFLIALEFSKMVEQEDNVRKPSIKEKRDLFSTIKKWEDFFNRINEKKKEFIKENKRINKIYSDEITKLNKLKNNLEKNDNQEEITNIDELLEYSSEEFKKDILIYIKENNKKYNEKLAKKYSDLSKNSISKYINIFGKNNIDFLSFQDAEQKIIMSYGFDYIEKVINFLNKIKYKFKNEILLIIAGTSNSVIDNMNEYIKKDYVNTEFIKNNINVLLLSNNEEEISYNLFIKNMKLLLDKGINIKCLDSDGMNFYISNSKLIENNLLIIESKKINIKTRNLKNYNFLGEENLEEKIEKLKEFNIDINNNIDVLNADDNIIKRIKLCNDLDIDIYDENKKIKQEILKKDLFFIPDSKIDEYIIKKTLVLN